MIHLQPQESTPLLTKWLLVASLLFSLLTFSASGAGSQSYQKQCTRTTTLIIAQVKDRNRIAFYKNILPRFQKNRARVSLYTKESEFYYGTVIKTILRENAKQIFPSIKIWMLSSIAYVVRSIEEHSLHLLRG